MLLSEALKQYIAWGKFQNKSRSMDTYRNDLRLLVLYLHDCRLLEVKLEDIIGYLDMMVKLGYEAKGFVHKCSSFKQFFKFFRKQGLKVVDPDLIPIPEVEAKYPKIIEEVDYKKLLSVIGEKVNVPNCRARALLNILWDTGVRIGELRSMKIEDIDLENKRCRIKTEKSRGVRPIRMVFWTKETNENLKVWLELRKNFLASRNAKDDGWLWITGHNRWHEGAQMSDTAISELLHRLSVEADLGYVANAHRFRHHFGRNLALQGANNSILSDLMGHSNLESSRIYTVMNPEMMQETYKKYNKG